MTYPPQQPGPYGQQPGQYGQQPGGGFPPSGPQQQPGYPGQYGQPPQQGGYPGGARQDPYGGYPGGAPQPPYPQQQGGFDAYGQQQPGGFPFEIPPKKKKTGLIIGLAVAVVLVIGGVVTLILVNSGGSSGNQAQDDVAALKAVGTKFASGFTNGDAASMKQTMCDPTTIKDQVPPEKVTVTGEPTVTGTTGKVQFTGVDPDTGKADTTPLDAQKKNGTWCLILPKSP